MTDRQTAAYPPGPPPRSELESDAATLLAGPESAQDTLFDPSQVDADPTVAPDENHPRSSSATLSRGSTTVLPDVRSEGERLIIVPRDRARYEANELLGRGGMGEVKLAHDHDIGRRVALKRLRDEQNPHALARFIDEVRTVGSLEHPNIVPIHDVGVDEDGGLFFVMKYVEGETLASIIDKLRAGDREYHERYSFEARLDIFAGLLRALHYAHSQGLVHRDIKPENLMVGRYGEVMVMDWGIAHAIRGHERPRTSAALPDIERASTETVDGSVVGTPQYMSPEQAAGRVAELDGRSDLYSAFVVLWELITLTPYIERGKTAMETILAVQEQRPPLPIDPAFQQNQLQDAVPAELRHFLRQGLLPDRDARYGSAEEALHQLGRVRSGEFAVTCMVTFMKHNNHKLGRLMDRYPGSSMFLALAGAVAFIGGVAGWFAWLLG